MSEFVIESITELFHLVKSLIPEGQEPVCVSPSTTVAEAINKMEAYNFSQLPVVQGEAVLGIFSYRTFASRLLHMGPMKVFAGDLPVDEFVEQISFVQLSENWEKLLPSLDKDDVVLVGGHEQLDGLVTTMDVLNYLRTVATPFVLMAEIEMTLRRLIRACVNEEELRISAVNSLASKYPTVEEMPTDLSHMEFNDYAQIIGNRENWPQFATVFGETDWSRTATTQKLFQIRNLRNDIFHFRRKIEQQDIEDLTGFRNWLQLKARTFAARHRLLHPTTPSEVTESVEDIPKWDEPSFLAALAENHLDGEVAVATQILAWAKLQMPEIWWGKGKVYGSFIPGFTNNGVWHQIVGVWTNGYVELQFQYMRGRPVFDSDEQQIELIGRFNEIPGIQIGKDQVGKRPLIRLSALTGEETLQAFLNVLNWYVDKIKYSKTGLADRRLLRYQFWSQLLGKAQARTAIHANISPSHKNWISASSGVRGFGYNYAIRMHDARIELYIDRGNVSENKQLFQTLFEKRTSIEKRFGNKLEWLPLEGKRASIIRHTIEEMGGLQDEATLPKLQEEMIEAMVRFSEAIQPEIIQINL